MPDSIQDQKKLAILIATHRAFCTRHVEPVQHVCGLISFSPSSGEARCRWCTHVENVGLPPEDALLLDNWVCKLIETGQRLNSEHCGCLPDPARNGVKAHLVRLVTSDGIADLNDDVQIGDEYIVYPHTRRVLEWGHESRPNDVRVRESMYVAASKHGRAGWMPCELFEVVVH